MIQLRTDRLLKPKELIDLFHSVGWGRDISDVSLHRAMCNSTNVVTAYDDDRLIGLIRSMDDHIWHANIDCLVVHPDYQHQGIGAMLISRLLDILAPIPTISVSPNESKNFALYEQFGFKLVKDGGLLQLYK